MIVLRSTLVVVVALVLSVSFSVPAEGMAETDYNDSESLPCDSTALTSIAVSARISPLPPSTFAQWRYCSEKQGGDDFNYRTDPTWPISDSLAVVNRPLRC